MFFEATRPWFRERYGLGYGCRPHARCVPYAQFLPKGLQDTDAVYQLVPAQLPKGCGQGDERNGQRVRTLSVDSKRVAIKCRFLKPGTTRKHILGIVPLHRQEEQRQYRVANGKP